MAGPSTLFVVLVGYTAFTLAMMAQFGRDEWRSQGETFTVWFRLLGRLASFPLVDEDGRVAAARVRERPARAGLDGGRRHARRASAWHRSSSTGCRRRRCSSTCSACRASRSRPCSCSAFLGIVVAARLPRRPDGRVCGASAPACCPIALGLPHRPLPDLPAHRRPAHRHRDLRPVPEGLGPVRDRVLRAERGLAAAGPGLDRPAGGGGRRPHARRVGRPRRRGRGCAAPGIAGRALRRRQLPLAVVMVGLTTLTLWSLGQAIVVTPTRSRRRPTAGRRHGRSQARPTQAVTQARRSGAGRRHPLVERAHLGQPAGDRRVERLGGGDRGLDRGQAQDPLGGRRQADLGGVADRAGARRRRVDDEPHLARRDELEDRRPRRRPRRPPRRAWRPAARRTRRARQRRARPGRRRQPVAGVGQRRRQPRQRAPCRGRRSTAARARPPRPAAAARAPRRAAPWPAPPAGRSWIPMTSPVDCMPGPDRWVHAAQLGRREGRGLDRDEGRRREQARHPSPARAASRRARSGPPARPSGRRSPWT